MNFYFCADSQANLQAYECPRYFQDDWLNDYFDVLCKEPSDSKPSAIDGVIDSDYRFVYLGKKVTYSHAQNPTVAPFPVSLYWKFDGNDDNGQCSSRPSFCWVAFTKSAVAI